MMPQYSPYVTILGGTALTLQSNTYSEVGWSQSGGGPSNLFAEPSWQTGPGVPQNNKRNIPDIALDASCDTSYAFDWNGDQETWFCGTSAAAPTFAGIMAQIRLLSQNLTTCQLMLEVGNRMELFELLSETTELVGNLEEDAARGKDWYSSWSSFYQIFCSEFDSIRSILIQ